MSFKEVKELRQAGQLDEAMAMAMEDLSSDPENIWNKRSVAWVHYEFLKKYASNDTFDLFLDHLAKIIELKLPDDENILFENCAWQIGKLMFAMSQPMKKNDEGLVSIKDVLRKFSFESIHLIKEIPFTKPHPSYSYLFKACHKIYKHSNDLEFYDWWDFDNFLPEDFIEDEVNGRKIMSIGEQAYITYSKILLEGESPNPFSFQKTVNKSKVESFIPKLERVSHLHPNLVFPQYFLAKLHLSINDNNDVLESFIPFAKRKKGEFWVWSLMAEIVSNDEDLQFACYCKALSLGAHMEYLIKVKTAFTELLVGSKLYDEAKTEINQIINVSTQNSWKLNAKVAKWTSESWFLNAKSAASNHELYKTYLGKAEELLYKDIPEVLVAVEFVNSDRNILNFVKNRNHTGFFNYSNLNIRPKVGDLLAVRFDGTNRDGFHNALSVRKVDSNTECEALKRFSGHINIRQDQSFGFVGDFFVDPSIISSLNLINGDEISGLAILSFNKKKNEWGWKVAKLDSIAK
jgi:hypothetical protein